MSKESDEYERVAQVILNNLRDRLGFERVVGTTKPVGKRSGKKIQIDCTAYGLDGSKTLIECRKHSRPIDVNQMRAFYYVVYRDIEADGGIIVSPVGFQEGAEAVAHAEKIDMFLLNADATEGTYTLQVGNQIFGSRSVPVTVSLTLASEAMPSDGKKSPEAQTESL